MSIFLVNLQLQRKRVKGNFILRQEVAEDFIRHYENDDIKADLQADLILLMDEFDYLPVTRDDVYEEVLEQAENFKKYAE